MTARGFSMIELVMVMAVIAILALMAVPTFLDRNVQLQVQDGIALANLAKNGVNAFYGAKNELPNSNEEAGVPPREKLVSNVVSEISIDGGAVTIKFGNNVNSSIVGKQLTMRPAIVKDAPTVPISWLCNNTPVPNGMTVMGSNQTNIPLKWLPIACRN